MLEPGEDREHRVRLVDRMLDYPRFGDDPEPGMSSLRGACGGLLVIPHATRALAKAFSEEAGARTLPSSDAFFRLKLQAAAGQEEAPDGTR